MGLGILAKGWACRKRSLPIGVVAGFSLIISHPSQAHVRAKHRGADPTVSAPAPSKALSLLRSQKATLREALGRQLKDYSSARFRDVRLGWHDGGPHWPDEAVLCGMVNSRNSYGGYTGFERFGIAFSGMSPPRIFIGDSLTDLEHMAQFSNNPTPDTFCLDNTVWDLADYSGELQTSDPRQ